MKICIDSGHGGYDSGATGNGLIEKDINLKVARMLYNICNPYAEDVFLTRNSDLFIALTDRAQASNDGGADLFISIHCNSAENTSATGAEVFFYEGDTKAEQYAGEVLTRICNATGLRNRGTKAGNFAVLRQTKAPAILIELAFISNPQDVEILVSDTQLYKIARAIAEGVGIVADNTETKEWYNDAQYWAKEQNISDGTRPLENVTRAEVWTMLHRFAKLNAK